MNGITFDPQYADEDFKAALTTEEQTTAEVALKVKSSINPEIKGSSHTQAKNALNRLADQGLIERIKVKSGGRFGFTYKWKLKGE